ncbi:hypothetical protein SAMN05421594_3237 [Chryseobacterium oleae]|uniref:C1q domain-containing protein n=1 Tax=Chryseobacterium oleae TaxID=491207 RepID=A0A1I5A0Q4_CHROL|nr:hypothetical protein [Chryseobacterium oleae]SFN55996.1 hypothetical protein SAMN05421594_3237 [Chryseobacterium oleae]
MKTKQIYSLLAFLAIGSTCFSQVGIATLNPQSTLDITGNGASTTAKDGVMAPRITRRQLAAKVAGTYAAAQSGALVYITDATTPTGTIPSVAQTIEITAAGYYFFNGTLWKNVNDGALNLYNSNGILLGPRTVTQAANTLAFTSTATNGFSVDGTTLSVDAVNDRIGVGTAAPSNKLHINGTDPLRLQGTTVGNTTTDPLLVLDTNGVVKTIGTLGALSIPTPAVFRLETTQSDFLISQGIGGLQVVPMNMIKNSIPGISYNTASSTITFPAGTYQINFVYEGGHDAPGCTISSYFVDFPLNASTTRIHSTSSHNQGGASNHGGTITYVTTLPANRTWQIHLGRGQSGNCSGAGMGLAGSSTQLLVFRIGD